MPKVANVQFYENSNECFANNSQKRLQAKRYTYLIPTNMAVKPGDICVVRVFNDNNGPFRFVRVDTIEDKAIVGKHKFIVARLDIEDYLEQERLEEARAEAREFMRRKALEMAEDQQYLLVLHRLTPQEREYITNTLGLTASVETLNSPPVHVNGPGYYTVTGESGQQTTLYTSDAVQAIETVSTHWGVPKEKLTATPG